MIKWRLIQSRDDSLVKHYSIKVEINYQCVIGDETTQHAILHMRACIMHLETPQHSLPPPARLISVHSLSFVR